MERKPLPAPATAIDMYLYDIAQSLRDVVDLVTPAPPPDGGEVTELREPAAADVAVTSEIPKSTKARRPTRDELQAADAAASAAAQAAALDLPIDGDGDDDVAHAVDPRDVALPPVNLDADEDKPTRRRGK